MRTATSEVKQNKDNYWIVGIVAIVAIVAVSMVMALSIHHGRGALELRSPDGISVKHDGSSSTSK